MSVKIAIASGKGGTGKTTVAVNLFHAFAKSHNNVQLVDCDVEEPNCILFYNNAERHNTEKVQQLIPEIDTEACTFCKKCQDYCEFNAISIIPSAKYAHVNTDLCHSCGACTEACQFNAVHEHKKQIGTISYYPGPIHVRTRIIEGRLKVGSPMQTMVIKELKKRVDNGYCLTIFDAPPGTSCSVVETISDADFVILVTEPTPFGLYDLQLTVELIQEMDIPFGVIINKWGLKFDDTLDFIRKNKIELLAEIPYDKQYACNYAQGKLLEGIPENISSAYKKLMVNIQKKVSAANKNHLVHSQNSITC